jgi:hypothetical protein
MRKILLGAVAVAAIATPLALASTADAATTQVSHVTVVGASEAPTTSDALVVNSQFSVSLAVSGEVNWYQNQWNTHLTYNADGSFWTEYNTVPDNVQGLPLPGAQVGQVVYRLDNGAWKPLCGKAIVSPDGKSHVVSLLVNDVPGQYGDNSGSFDVTVNRVKG